MIKINIIEEIINYDETIHVRMFYDIPKSELIIKRKNSYFNERTFVINNQTHCKYSELYSCEEELFNDLKVQIVNEFNINKRLLKEMNLDIEKIEENIKKITSTNYKNILRSEKLKRIL